MATHLQALHPYLTFSGNCRQAMLAYHAAIGGQLHLQTVADAHSGQSFPPEIAHLIAEARLTCGAFTLQATDLTSHSRIPGNQMAVCLASTDHGYLTQILQALQPGLAATFTHHCEFEDAFQVHWHLRWIHWEVGSDGTKG